MTFTPCVGSGKTTFLNELAGFDSIGVTRGEILFNGSKRNARKQRKMMKYVQQDDLLMGHLTVQETLEYAAFFCLPPGTTSLQRKLRISKVIQSFRLDGCRNVLVGSSEKKGISGGQRKRLHIAAEIISDPTFMLLDEPTTGLDSRTSLTCIDFLRDMAHSGRTVICTIHQPGAELFSMFDNIMLLCRGQIAYYGPTSAVVDSFGAVGLKCPLYHNPADYIVEVVHQHETARVMDLIDRYKNSNMHMVVPDPSKPSPYPNFGKFRRYQRNPFSQFLMLLRRAFLMNLRNRPYIFGRIAAHIVAGLLIGILFFQIGDNQNSIYDRLSLLIFACILMVLVAMIPTVVSFPLERVIFQREHMNNWYGVGPYYAAKLISDLPMIIILPVLFVAMLYPLAFRFSEWSLLIFLQLVIIYMLQALVGFAKGILISTVAPTMTVGVFVSPMLTIPLVLFSGFAIITSNLPFPLCDLPSIPIDGQLFPPPAQWFHEAGGCWSVMLSYFYYSFGAAVRAVFDNLTFTCPAVPDFPHPVYPPAGNGSHPHPGPPPSLPNCCTLQDGQDVIDLYGFDHWWNNLWFVIIVMLSLMTFFLVLGYLVLKRKTKGGISPKKIVRTLLRRVQDSRREKYKTFFENEEESDADSDGFDVDVDDIF